MQSRSPELKRQEACAKKRRANAGTEGEGGSQPLSAPDMDMGRATMPGNCPICLPMEGLSFITRSFSGRRYLEFV
jgi:hypothetical protein